MSRAKCAFLLVWLGLIVSVWAEDATVDRGEPSALLLGLDSAWRGHLTLRTPLVGPRDAAQPRAELDMWADSEFPPKDWMAPVFDDSSWMRTTGGQFVGATARGGGGELGKFGFGQRLTCALLCLRGRFEVDDPSKIRSLTVSAEYRGGVVVYLNGTEVARAHMPGGPVQPDTLAESYPREAYFDPDGEPLTLEYCSGLLRYPKGRPVEQVVRDRLNLRIRRLTAEVPATLLRKGVNVLALAIHRVSDHPDFKIDSRGGMVYMFPGWGSVGLLEFKLTGGPASATSASQKSAGGLRAWNCSVLQRVWRDKWVGSPEPVSPVRIVGTRNGVFAG